jgi:hypothetical protein
MRHTADSMPRKKYENDAYIVRPITNNHLVIDSTRRLRSSCEQLTPYRAVGVTTVTSLARAQVNRSANA